MNKEERKAREKRLMDEAARQGYKVTKARTGFSLADKEGTKLISSNAQYKHDPLDDLEEWLWRP